MTTGSPRPSDAAATLDFGDPLSMRSADDTDSGWGERTGGGTASSGGSGGDAAADLARFLDEKPPHHL